MTPPATRAPVRITLVRNEPSCRKCRETEAVLETVASRCPGAVEVTVLTVAEAHVAGLAAVLTPTVLVNGKVLCAGIVPRRDGVLQIVEREWRQDQRKC